MNKPASAMVRVRVILLNYDLICLVLIFNFLRHSVLALLEDDIIVSLVALVTSIKCPKTQQQLNPRLQPDPAAARTTTSLNQEIKHREIRHTRTNCIMMNIYKNNKKSLFKNYTCFEGNSFLEIFFWFLKKDVIKM